MTVHLTRASAPLTERVLAVDELGQAVEVSIPAERALTLYVDKRELVTLMTLGAHPEWLVLGYLRNQRLLAGPAELASITVDWDAGAAAVRTRHGIADLRPFYESDVRWLRHYGAPVLSPYTLHDAG